jgi:hypothetical protein
MRFPLLARPLLSNICARGVVRIPLDVTSGFRGNGNRVLVPMTLDPGRTTDEDTYIAAGRALRRPLTSRG